MASTVVENPVRVFCPKCEKERTLSISFEDIKRAVNTDFAVTRDTKIVKKCSQCAYRERRASRPLTEEQKARRSEYNKRRRSEIAAALSVYRAQQADTDEVSG